VQEKKMTGVTACRACKKTAGRRLVQTRPVFNIFSKISPRVFQIHSGLRYNEARSKKVCFMTGTPQGASDRHFPPAAETFCIRLRNHFLRTLKTENAKVLCTFSENV